MNSSFRILLTQDTPDERERIAQLLAQADYTVYTATSADEALRLVEEQCPDLLLLFDLPDTNPLDICRRVKRNPAATNAFVVVASATFTESEEQTESGWSGPDGYIVGSVGDRELLARVASFIRILRLTRSLRRQTQELEQHAEVRRLAQLASINLMEDAVEARDRAERALQSLATSEARYRSLVNSAPVAILINRSDRVELVNDACLRLFGATAPEQLLGKSPFELFHPDDHRGVQERIRQLREQGLSVPLIEERIVRLDGTVVDVEVTAATFEDQGVNAIHVVLHDITERKRAERELHEVSATLQAAMDQSSAGIAIAKAPGGALQYVNDAGLLIRGEDRQHVANGVGIDQYVASWHLMDLDGRPLRSDEVPLARAILYGETCSREFIIRRAPDDDRIVLANATPIRDPEGRIVAGIVVFSDITERKRVELRNAEQLAELQRWHGITVRREGRVLALKAEVNALLANAGLPPRYPSALPGSADEGQEEPA